MQINSTSFNSVSRTMLTKQNARQVYTSMMLISFVLSRARPNAAPSPLVIIYSYLCVVNWSLTIFYNEFQKLRPRL